MRYTPSADSSRRYDLDWLRIIAVFLLVPFHSALIFSLDPNSIVYIKAYVESQALVSFAGFLNLWHMPLLFVIAGASTWFALGKRSSGQYLKERVQRLLIPFLFGVAVLVPLMTYIHYLRIPGSPSFWQFYPGFFTINPADLSGIRGTFTPAHLWFIMYLFLFSFAALPLFTWLKNSSGSNVIRALGSFFSHRGALLLCAVLTTLASSVDILGDKNPINYFLLFVLGFLLVSDSRIQMAIDHDWPLYAGLGILGTVFYFASQHTYFPAWTAGWVFSGVAFHFTRWIWVLAILGAGHRWLNTTNAALRYASEAAFPYYILHMPVNTLIGFWIIQLNTSIAVKYTLIVLLTTLVTLAIYDLLVRRIPFLRFLFGVKSRMQSAKKQELHPVSAGSR